MRISTTKAPLILYIDDDNLLPRDYLDNALSISREFPQLGSGCGDYQAGI